MKKNRAMTISLISIILFNIFFMTILIFYNDIIIVPNKFLKSTTREYWYWYAEVRSPVKYESTTLGITYIAKLMFSLIFPLEFFYIISSKKYMSVIGKKSVIISLIIGFIINCLSFLFIKYQAAHYRLFMTLISTEVSSLVLLNLILQFKNRS